MEKPWHLRFFHYSGNGTKVAKHAKDFDAPTTTLNTISKNKDKNLLTLFLSEYTRNHDTLSGNPDQRILLNPCQAFALNLKKHFRIDLLQSGYSDSLSMWGWWLVPSRGPPRCDISSNVCQTCHYESNHCHPHWMRSVGTGYAFFKARQQRCCCQRWLKTQHTPAEHQGAHRKQEQPCWAASL